MATDRVRVVLANGPEMVREMLAKILHSCPGIEVVGESQSPVDLLLLASETRPDVAIVTLPADGEEPGVCSHLLAEHPDLGVLALAPDRDEARLYRRGHEVHSLSGFDLDDLLQTVLTACSRDGGGKVGPVV